MSRRLVAWALSGLALTVLPAACGDDEASTPDTTGITVPEQVPDGGGN